MNTHPEHGDLPREMLRRAKHCICLIFPYRQKLDRVPRLAPLMIYNQESDIRLMCLKSPGGPETAAETMGKLESALSSLKGRRFYGLFREHEGGETYLACTRIEPGDNPEALGLMRVEIPEGKYDREKLPGWEEKWDGTSIEGLPELFGRMFERNAGTVDAERFCVEYYRSRKELILMLPLK